MKYDRFVISYISMLLGRLDGVGYVLVCNDSECFGGLSSILYDVVVLGIGCNDVLVWIMLFLLISEKW